MADVVVRRRSAGWLRPGTPAVPVLAALCALPVLAALAGCTSSSKPARVVEAKPAAAEAPAAETKTAPAAAEIRAMDLREGAPEVYLDLEASAPLVWTSFRNSEGKVVVELPNALPAAKLHDLAPEEGLVASVKVERATEGSRPMTRLIISTRHEVEHSVSANGSNLQVRLLPLDEAAAATSPKPAAVAPAPATPSASASASPGSQAGTPASPAPGSSPTPPSAPKLAYEPVPPAEPAAAASPSGGARGGVGTPDQPAMGTAPAGAPATRLEAIEVVAAAGPSTVIRITGDGDFPYSTFMLESPNRFVVDLQGVVNRSTRSTVAVQGGVVERVRVAQFKPPPKGVARVVFDLQQNAAPQVERAPHALVVTFPNAGSSQAMAATTPSTTPAPAPPSPAPSIPSAAPSTPSERPPAAATPSAKPASAKAPPAETPKKSATRSRTTAAAAPAAGAGAGATSDLALRATPSGSASKRSGIEIEDAPLAQASRANQKSSSGDLPRVAEAGRALPPPADLGLRNTGATGKPVGPFTPGENNPAAGTLGQTEETFVGEPIDLKVTNADVTEVLRTFAQISGLNVVVQPGVNGTVTAELENVPWDQALYEVLKINNLGYELNGNVMRIAPLSVLKQEATERQQLAQARALAIPLKTIMRRLSYANANNIAGLLRSGSAGLLSQRGSVIVDDRTNTLIIKELPTYLDTIMSVVENLDTPEPQVIIEARIIETTKRFTRNLGVNWGFNAVADAAHGNTTGLVFPNNGSLTGAVNLPGSAQNGTLNLKLGNVLNTFTLDLALQAAESEGLINILSAPKVATLNNQLASIQSGVQIPVQTVANNTVSVQYINATLRLDVTPQVTAEGTVLMDITITKREPQFAFLVPGSTNAPIATKDAKTRLVVRDGGTAVIGGIYQITSDNGENRVPGLAKIPIIGHLFKDKSQREENDELLIFITPRVIKL
jgi:type IV pilus assembly protein PilQ